MQRKAWCCQQACIDWVYKFFSQDVKEVPGNGTNLLFMDNLDGQTTKQFQQGLKKAANANAHYYTAQATDEIQTIDGGIGKEVKRVYQQLLEEKLISDQLFYNQWTSHGGMTASEKRVLITELAGQAHAKVMASVDVEKIARRCGNLMTIDGTMDDEIRPQGMESYSFGPEHALLAAQNVKGDFNEKEAVDAADVIEETEGGFVGELDEIVEDEDMASEGEEESDSEEEEEVLLVRQVLGCEWQGATLKYQCVWRGFEENDTTWEPKCNIEPKSVLADFIAAGEKDGSYPPEKPVKKRKRASKAVPKKQASPKRSCPSRNVKASKAVHDEDSDEEMDEPEEVVNPKASGVASASTNEAACEDLRNSDEEVLRAPVPSEAGGL